MFCDAIAFHASKLGRLNMVLKGRATGRGRKEVLHFEEEE
jgi:hypothetical protein